MLIWGTLTGSDEARLPISGVKTMNVKSVILVTAVAAAVALTACRREVVHEPMKLGADVPAASQVAR
jgi:hypothetical protein